MDWSRLFQDIGPSVGFGGAAGLVVGFATKKITKFVAIGLGVLFILIQVLAYYRFISVNWGEVEAQATGFLIDSHGNSAAEQFWNMVTSNLPFGAAFAAGFAIGFKQG